MAKIANAESLRLHFIIGYDLDREINQHNWGDKILDAIAVRLQQELPGLRGFSASNLKKMRLFYHAWESVKEISSSLTNQIVEILKYPSLSQSASSFSNSINEKSNHDTLCLTNQLILQFKFYG